MDTEGTTDASEQSAAERGFAEGEHVVLRPVKEDDLRPLAALLAECPCEEKPMPWTHQRLKKKFEDEKEPGLWGKRERHFAVARKTGGVVGFLHERDDWTVGIFWCVMHVADALKDRDELGRDVLATYLAYKQRWHDPLRISFNALQPEQAKIGWLEQCDFELELTQERYALYLGEPVALKMYTWLGPRLRKD